MEESIQAKRRIHELPVIGGGGIEGLAVWGGAFVTIRKGRKVDQMKEMEDNVGGKGMQFVIPVNENPSEKFYETSKIDSSELVPIKNLISEENAVYTIIDVNGEKKDFEGGHQEIPLSDAEQESIAISDDSERGNQEILLLYIEVESITFSDYYSVAEEFSLPSTDSSPWNDSESMSNGDDEEESFSTPTESSLSTVSSTGDENEEEDSSIQSSTSSMLSVAEEFQLLGTVYYEEKSSSTPTESSLSTVSSTDDEEEYSSTSSTLSAAEEFLLQIEYQHLF